MTGPFPKITLAAPDSAQADIYLHGAHVASWITPDGRERLFMSERADFQPGAALRGGVPVVFPQFSGLGSLPKHGLVRTTSWEWFGTETGEAGTETARFRLRDSGQTRALWNHAFQLDLAVTVGGAQLHMALHVTNTGAAPFTFTAALHTYLRVDDIAAVTVEGLENLPYRQFGLDAVQDDAPLRIRGETDRIYWAVPGPIRLCEGDHTVHVTASGFPDAVVWNPGPEKTAALPDMAPDGYQRMLCIEAALISAPVILPPGAVWDGSQTLTAL